MGGGEGNEWVLNRSLSISNPRRFEYHSSQGEKKTAILMGIFIYFLSIITKDFTVFPFFPFFFLAVGFFHYSSVFLRVFLRVFLLRVFSGGDLPVSFFFLFFLHTLVA